jgi:hypothetical protein
MLHANLLSNCGRITLVFGEIERQHTQWVKAADHDVVFHFERFMFSQDFVAVLYTLIFKCHFFGY